MQKLGERLAARADATYAPGELIPLPDDIPQWYVFYIAQALEKIIDVNVAQSHRLARQLLRISPDAQRATLAYAAGVTEPVMFTYYITMALEDAERGSAGEDDVNVDPDAAVSVAGLLQYIKLRMRFIAGDEDSTCHFSAYDRGAYGAYQNVENYIKTGGNCV